MAGRGRGRGALGRWGPSPGSGYSSDYDGRAVASVPPLKKELPLALDSNSNDNRMCCVRVTCIIDVNHFWAQLGSESELGHFDSYMFALNNWCENQIPAALNDMPSVGQVVCVRHTATRTWRRAEVTRLCQRMVDVFFLDFGEAECVPLNMLCSNVPGDITSWPPQALYCTLEGVQPPRGEDQWSEKAVRLFTELVTCGQRVSASRESGSFQLMLYIIDDVGQLKSVGSILAEQGLAQETRGHSITNNEAPWLEESQGQHQKDRRAVEKPDLKSLDKLEQQLVMSGFSYLIPNKSEEPENKVPEGYSYEKTTTSSSYYSYKGKIEDNQHQSSSNNQDQAALVSQYHPSFKHFHSPMTQVLPSSNSMPSFTPTIESTRNHPATAGSHHLSTRPHLASPGEFMSSSKGQSQIKNQEHGSISGEEKPNRYIPPPLRMNQAEGDSTIPRNDVSQPSSWYSTSCSLVNNTWSPSEQTVPSNWPSVPNNDDMKAKHPFGLGDGLSYESQRHKDREITRQMDSSFQDAQDAAFALQQHLEGPSAFHDPKNNQHTLSMPLNLPIKCDKDIVSQVQSTSFQPQQLGKNQQKLPASKAQSSQESDKTIKKELSWQKWKFQRNVKRVLEKITKETITDLSYEIGTLISESKLSQNFEGVSEIVLVLEMIVEKVLDKKGFATSAARICHVLSGLDILRFPDYFYEVITAFRDNIVQHYTISDWKQRCQRFCNFMGEMFLNLFLNENDLDDRFKSVVSTLLKQSIEKWSSLEQDRSRSERELDVFVVCLVSLLRVIGPALEGDSLRIGDMDVDQIFSSVRDQVLSTDLPRSARNDLLDLMLLRAAGWPEDPQEIDNNSGDDGSDGVIVEQGGTPEDESLPNDDVLEDWSQNDDEDWDPYAKVRTMLQKLKLEVLFEKFKENCIRDSLLVADKEDFKKTLQEAGFAPGVILEIRMYLEKGDVQATTENINDKSNKLRMNNKEALGSLEGKNSSANTLEIKDDPTQRNDPILENPFKFDDEQRGRCDNLRNDSEGQSNQEENEAMQEGDDHIASSKIHKSFDPKGPLLLRHSSKADRRRNTLEHTLDDNKVSKIDAHHLFEPSYLSRIVPLKLETTTYEYEAGPDSPSNQGPKSYSAVVKSKNDESSPEATTKTMAVKLISLTKANSSDGPKDINQACNKQALGKTTPKEASKETSGKRDPSLSASRPPPGFPPLPPQNWGQSPDIRLTVLNAKQRGKSDDGPAGGSPVVGSPGSGTTVCGPMIGRGGAASRGRTDHRWKGGSDEVHSPSQNWQGRSMTGPSSNWRQRNETKPHDEQNNSRNKVSYRESGFGNIPEKKKISTPTSYGGGFPQNKTEQLRPFGEGGPKACFNCGSKDHFTCHDRSKMFFD